MFVYCFNSWNRPSNKNIAQNIINQKLVDLWAHEGVMYENDLKTEEAFPISTPMDQKDKIWEKTSG